MADITVTCDRCKTTVEGFECPEATSGFYRARDGQGPWAKYMRSGEVILCDNCMSHDEGYQRDYWPAKD